MDRPVGGIVSPLHDPCKALLMSQNPFNLILREGDMVLMEQNGLAAFLDNHFSLAEGQMIESFIIQPHIFGYCPLLDYQTSKCTIYITRPKVCRLFPYNVTPHVAANMKEINRQLINKSIPSVMTSAYDVALCPLAHIQAQNHPTYFKKHEYRAIQDHKEQLEAILGNPHRDPDKYALLEAKRLHVPFQVLEMEAGGVKKSIIQEIKLQHSEVIHRHESNDWGSFIISSLRSLKEWMTPKIMTLVEEYQTFFKQEETVIAITVVDDSILREAARRGLAQNSHIQYVPLYRIRGIFSPYSPPIPRRSIWRRLRKKHSYCRADGSLLTGLLFVQELEQPPSYWEKCWNELKELYQHPPTPLPTSKSKNHSCQKNHQKIPFKPRRRRK